MYEAGNCGAMTLEEGKRVDVRGNNERDTFGERAECSS